MFPASVQEKLRLNDRGRTLRSCACALPVGGDDITDMIPYAAKRMGGRVHSRPYPEYLVILFVPGRR